MARADSECEQTDFYNDDSDRSCEQTDHYEDTLSDLDENFSPSHREMHTKMLDIVSCRFYPERNDHM